MGGWDVEHRLEKIFHAAKFFGLDPTRYTLLQRWAEANMDQVKLKCDSAPYTDLLPPFIIDAQGRQYPTAEVHLGSADLLVTIGESSALKFTKM